MDLSRSSQNRLVFYRRSLGLTQGQVSRLLGHHDPTMLSQYEHGVTLPPLAIALALEIILRTPVAFLFPALYDDLKRRIRAQEAAGNGAADHHAA